MTLLFTIGNKSITNPFTSTTLHPARVWLSNTPPPSLPDSSSKHATTLPLPISSAHIHLPVHPPSNPQPSPASNPTYTKPTRPNVQAKPPPLPNLPPHPSPHTQPTDTLRQRAPWAQQPVPRHQGQSTPRAAGILPRLLCTAYTRVGGGETTAGAAGGAAGESGGARGAR